MGSWLPASNDTPPDLAELRAAVQRAAKYGRSTCWIPGPPGTLAGDLSWVIAARESGRLPLLIVQGVLRSDLTAAADFVLPGSTSFEKDAAYTNDQEATGRGSCRRATRGRTGRLPDSVEPGHALRNPARVGREGARGDWESRTLAPRSVSFAGTDDVRPPC